MSAENRTFELHSPDGVHSCILRASDANEAVSWFNSLHSALYVLTVKALKEANNVLSPTLIGGELHHIGWLSTRKQRLNYGVEVSQSDYVTAPSKLELFLTLSVFFSLRRVNKRVARNECVNFTTRCEPGLDWKIYTSCPNVSRSTPWCVTGASTQPYLTRMS